MSAGTMERLEVRKDKGKEPYKSIIIIIIIIASAN